MARKRLCVLFECLNHILYVINKGCTIELVSESKTAGASGLQHTSYL